VIRGLRGGRPNHTRKQKEISSMNYLYEAIKPTRLYIKQCPCCGLKYFGKSTLEDVEKYEGSGVYWTNHLKKHRVEPIHLWNSDWYHDTSISRFALKFSRLNKIVSNEIWANLKEENGLDGGWDHVHNEETQEKARQNATKTFKEKYGVVCPSQLPHVREMNRGKEPWNKGKSDVFTQEAKKKMSIAASNRIHADSTKESIKQGVVSYYNKKGVSFIFIDGEVIEEIYCLKDWCTSKGLDYHKVFGYLDQGPIKMNIRYDTPTRRWFVGKEIRRK
jgi:hypothetical protein